MEQGVIYILEKEVLSCSFIGIASHIIIITISYCTGGV